jgi:hypothetical protein
MSEEEIKNFINKRKEIEKISIKSYIIRGSIPTSSKELSENDRNKIKKLLYTEDFTQSELADIFGVAQATISRILKIDRENIGGGKYMKVEKWLDSLIKNIDGFNIKKLFELIIKIIINFFKFTDYLSKKL